MNIFLILLGCLSLFLIIFFLGIFILAARTVKKRPPLRSGMYTPLILSHDSECGYINKPNFNSLYPFGVNQSYQLCTNPQGIRVNNATHHNPLPHHPILIVGNSQSLGFGINNEYTYAHQLETLIQHPVLNLSSLSYDLVPCIRRATQFLYLNPKAVILGCYGDVSACANRTYSGSNIKRISIPFAKIDAQGNLSIGEPTNNHLAIRLTDQYWTYVCGRTGWHFLKDCYWTAWLLWAEFCKKTPSRFAWNNTHVTPEKEATAIERLLKDFHQLLKQRNTKLILFHIASYSEKKATCPPTSLVDIAKKLSIPLIDSSKNIQNALDQSIDILIPHEGHLNERGHRVIAEKLAEDLQAFI